MTSAENLLQLGIRVQETLEGLCTAAAERLGVATTDYHCLCLLATARTPLPAGQIAKLAGKSTATITGVVDRLERAGHVRRLRHPEDRRSVLVEIADTAAMNSERWPTDQLREVVAALSTGYTPAELRAVTRYLTEVVEALGRPADAPDALVAR